MVRVINWQTLILAALLTTLGGVRLAADDTAGDDAPTADESAAMATQVQQPLRLSPASRSSGTVKQMGVPAAKADKPAGTADFAAYASDSEEPPAPEAIADDAPLMSESTTSACPVDCPVCGGPPTCCRCCQCGPPGRFWVRDEYIGWSTNGDHLPSLVTTGPVGLSPTQTNLFGQETVNNGFRSGNWLQAGMWLDCCRNWGIQADGFFLGRASSGFSDSTFQNQVIARPFIDSTTGLPNSQLVSYPGIVNGSIWVRDSNSLASGGAALRHNLWCCSGCYEGCDTGCFQGQNCTRVDLLAGARYYRYNDNLSVNEQLTSTSLTNGVPVGTTLNVNDTFRIQNNFYGGELGLLMNHYYGRWLYEVSGKVALGNNHQTIYVNGTTTVNVPGVGSSTTNTGLLAYQGNAQNPGNIGSFVHDQLQAIPQISFRLGYQVTQRFSVLAGYTALYWGQVAKAGDQVNLTVPPPPGTGNGPAFVVHESYLWAQGLTLGGEYHF